MKFRSGERIAGREWSLWPILPAVSGVLQLRGVDECRCNLSDPQGQRWWQFGGPAGALENVFVWMEELN